MQLKPKPHLVRMYVSHFLTQPRNLVWFADFILATKPNHNLKETPIKLMPLCPVLIETQWDLLENDMFFLLLSFFFAFYFKNVFICFYLMLHVLILQFMLGRS